MAAHWHTVAAPFEASDSGICDLCQLALPLVLSIQSCVSAEARADVTPLANQVEVATFVSCFWGSVDTQTHQNRVQVLSCDHAIGAWICCCANDLFIPVDVDTSSGIDLLDGVGNLRADAITRKQSYCC